MAFGDVIQHWGEAAQQEFLTVDWTAHAAPTSGNLILILAGNRISATMSTPAGYSLLWESGLYHTNKYAYLFAKIASASESNITLTDGSGGTVLFCSVVEVEGGFRPLPTDIIGYSGETLGNIELSDVTPDGLNTGTTGTLPQAIKFALAWIIAAGRSNNGTGMDSTTLACDSGFTVIGAATTDAISHTLNAFGAYLVTSATTALNPYLQFEIDSTGPITGQGLAGIAILEQSLDQTLFLNAIASAETVYIPTITTGAVDVTPDVVASAEAVYAVALTLIKSKRTAYVQTVNRTYTVPTIRTS